MSIQDYILIVRPLEAIPSLETTREPVCIFLRSYSSCDILCSMKLGNVNTTSGELSPLTWAFNDASGQTNGCGIDMYFNVYQRCRHVQRRR